MWKFCLMTCRVAALLFSLWFHLLIECDARSGAPLWWNMISLLQSETTNQSLAVAPQDVTVNVGSITCTRIPGLVPKQLRYCSQKSELMPSIASGIKQGIDQCKYQFKTKRWNCNTLPLRRKRASRRKSVFGSVLKKASREAAFVHSIAAAGVAHSVARECARGTMLSCGCDVRKSRRSLSSSTKRGWRWGGCNDDVDFGIKVSRDFADARDQGTNARAIMNRHNNKAGRLALKDKMIFRCKCHGLSGSCELKTCWWSLPDFKDVGDKLKRLYNEASEMTVRRHREARGWVETLKPKYSVFGVPSDRELLFFETSPNFCKRNKRLGIEGTKGRICNATSTGADGCDLLCCGRGHRTISKTRTEKCNCVFRWCCEVKCKDCLVNYNQHVCL